MKTVKFGFYLFFHFTLAFGCKQQIPDDAMNVRLRIPPEEMELAYSDIFEDFKIIPLQTSETSLIGEISKIRMTENHIFVLDSRQSNAVFIFEKNGKLVKKIASEGVGPGELLAPVNFMINEKDEQLIVFDGRQGKFLFYNTSGDFLFDIKKPSLASCFDMLSLNGHFYFLVDGSENWRSRILKTDMNFGKKLKIQSHFDGDFRLINGKKSRYFYERQDKKGFFFKERNHNRIVLIGENGIDNHFLFSFSTSEFKPDTTSIYEAQDFSRRFWGSGQFALGDDLIDSRGLTLLAINKGPEIKIALWKKGQNEVKIITSFKNDMDKIAPDINGIPPYNTDAGYFIWALHPRDLEAINSAKPLYENFYPKLSKTLSIDRDDNPILFIYKMKK